MSPVTRSANGDPAERETGDSPYAYDEARHAAVRAHEANDTARGIEGVDEDGLADRMCEFADLVDSRVNSLALCLSLCVELFLAADLLERAEWCDARHLKY